MENVREIPISNYLYRRYNAHRHKVQANLTFYTRIAVSLHIIHQH